jgi:hypothetical protein
MSIMQGLTRRLLTVGFSGAAAAAAGFMKFDGAVACGNMLGEGGHPEWSVQVRHSFS